jgi:sugar phosphate permease
MISLGLIRNLPTFYAAFLIVFTGAGLAGFIPLMSVINNWFVRRRATATALALTGTNLGGLLVPALAWAIINLGWQATAIGLGIAVWALSVPVMLVLRNRPEDVGLHPDGSQMPEQELQKTEIPVGATDQDFTARQALRTWAFWSISISHGIGATAFVTISLHILPALTDTGLSLQVASTVVAAYTGTAIASQLLGGYLGDRLPKTPLIALYMVIQGLGILVAANGPGLAGSYGFAVLFGIGFGGRVPLLVAIRGEYFGRRAFATILGISQLPMNVLMVAAPIGAGYLYDQQGSYFTPFLILTVACFAGAVLILSTRKPRHPGYHATAEPTGA